MHLAKVTPENFAAAIALRIRDDQQDLVAPVVKSLAEAYVSWEPREGGPEPFYRKLGFHSTGEITGGQTVGVRSLAID